MTILAIVVSMVGQAWAENANGERRALEVGDQLSVDETLIMAEGARVDLDFGDNQQLTFLGEHQVTAEERGSLTEQFENLSRFESSEQSTIDKVTSTQPGQIVLSEGHGFVQLVRIAEIIEADGITPLTIVRLQEVLHSLSIALPESELDKDFRYEHLGESPNRGDEYREAGRSGDGGNQPSDDDEHTEGGGEQSGNSDEQSEGGVGHPELSISINVIADDDIINAAEAEQTITLTGTVGGDAQPGDKVTITVNGRSYETTVNPDGKTWHTDVPGSELVQDNIVEATVTSSHPADEPITAAAERPYDVETTPPLLSVELEGAGPDGTYNRSEITNDEVPAKVILDDSTVNVGDILKVTTPDGEVLLERPVTQEDINNGVPVQVPVNPGQGNVSVEATITDPTGNSGSGRDEKPVDTLPPLLTGSLDPQNDQDADSINLDLSGKFNDTFSGSSLVYSAANLPDGLTIDSNTGVISGKIHSSASQYGNAGKGQYEVIITVADPAGNSSQHSFTWAVTNLIPTAEDDIGSTDEDTPLVVDAFNGILKNDVDPDGDKLFLTGVVAGSSKPFGSGGLDTDIPGEYGTLKLQEDGSYVYTPDKNNLNVRTLKDGETLEDIFSYTMTDREGGEDDAVLKITINGVNDGVTVDVPIIDTATMPDAVISDQVVFESGLLEGSEPEVDDTRVLSEFTLKALDGLDQNGTITISYNDISGSPASIVLSKAAIEDLGTTAQIISSEYGELKLYGFTQAVDGTIIVDYEYILNKAPDIDASDVTESFNITAKDRDGDLGTETLRIKIVDDKPIAVDDANRVSSGSYTAVTGNVIGGSTNASDEPDVLGADGATVALVTFTDPVTNNKTEVSLPAGNATTTIDGAFGVLTIQSDGSYSYQRDANTPGDREDIFEYTLADGDNDTDTARLTISIDNTTDVSIDGLTSTPGSSDVVVHESAFTDVGGRDAGTGVDAGSLTADNTFTITSPDGIAELSITHDGTTYHLVLDNVAQLLPTITTALGNELKVTAYDADLGKVNYTYILIDDETHSAQGQDDLFESFQVNLTDMDGDTTAGAVDVRIVDDLPVINQTADLVALTVDESDFTTNVADDFSKLFVVNYGADSAAAEDTVYTLSIDAVSGLVDTASGDPVTLMVNTEGTEVTGTADGQAVFTITIDSASGAITLDQHRAVKHPIKTHDNDSVSINTGAISINATATDGDGDKATSTLEIGDRFTFLDDGPSITATVTGAVLSELVTNDADTLTGISEVTVSFKDAFDALPNYGADGDGEVSWAYTLELDGGATSISSGLTTNNHSINLYIVGTEIVGSTAAVAEDINDENTAFTTTVAANGEVTLTQMLAIDHDTANSGPDFNSDIKTLAADLITLTGTATITDGDGDTASDSKTINIGENLVFQDDGPTLDQSSVDIDVGNGTFTDNSIVKEENLDSGSTPDSGALIVGKDLPINFGGDAVKDITFTSDTLDQLRDLELKSSGEPVIYGLNGDESTIAATADGKPIFVITLSTVGGVPKYEFILQGPLDHVLLADDSAENIVLAFEVTATDGDGDSVNLKFNVEVSDDTPSSDVRDLVVDEEGFVFFSNADINKSTTSLETGKGPFNGIVDIGDDGKITYTPDGDYRGEDSFTYQVTTASGIYTRDVKITVNPVADAAWFENLEDRADNGVVVTPEDTAATLFLKLPEIKDIGAADQTDPGYSGTDYSELLGAITLSFTTAPGVTGYAPILLDKNDEALADDGNGKYHFVIVDGSGDPIGLHIKEGLPLETDAGVHYITEADYEALQALPPLHRHENFEVVASVDSYEVDGDGKPLVGVASANSTQAIVVDVEAITDDIAIKVQEDTTQDGVTVVVSNSDKTADITFDEDTSFNLTNILNPDGFKDTDGSETRFIGLKGLPDDTLVTVGETEYLIGQSGMPTVNFGGVIGDIPALMIAGTETGLPNITITPPADFSGDLTDIEVILGAIDSDEDSEGNTGFTTPELETDSVTLNLHVKPIAGDVAVDDVEGLEDTAIEFLENIKITDGSTVDGTLGEVIAEVSFTVPAGWTIAAGADTWAQEGQTWSMGTPVDNSGWTGTWDGNTYTIIFTNNTLTETQREAILQEFTLTPPAHSSEDIDLAVEVTSVDHSIIFGGSLSDPVSKIETLTVVVKPVAESVDEDTASPGGDDVTINLNHIYVGRGEEDHYFKLGTEGAVGSETFKLSDNWGNEDGKETNTDGTGFVDGAGSEETYGIFTPYKTVGNSAMADAGTDGELDGSYFQYIDSSGVTHTLVFNGTPIKIPVAYLDTVQFKGPENFSGVVKIKVQAGTVDYDEDDGVATEMAVSGESWLTNIIIDPMADQVTLKVGARITAREDSGRDPDTDAIALNIIPSSDDSDETFNVTIKGIPGGGENGAVITYDGIDYHSGSTPDIGSGVTVTNETDGTFSVKIEKFNIDNQPKLTPPQDSNETINLVVETVSVDQMTYIDASGSVQTTIPVESDPHILPITITVQGAPDMPDMVWDNSKEYNEALLDNGSNTVALKDLITELKSGETTSDGSETVTLRISSLHENFSVVGVGPPVGSGSGTDRVWVVTPEKLADGSVKIQVPENYSGTVTFSAEPVVTESDNPSETFFVPENIQFKVIPAPEAELNISSTMTEDQLGRVDFSPNYKNGDNDEEISAIRFESVDGVTFYSDAAGTNPLTAVGGWYEVTGVEEVKSIYAQASPNASGTISLNVEYKVSDTAADLTTIPVESDYIVTGHNLVVQAVTDFVDLTLTAINGQIGSSSYELTAAGDVIVGLNIAKHPDANAGNENDYDSSEKLTHILVQGVPNGVVVQGGEPTGAGQWLLPATGVFTGAMSQDIVFNVNSQSGSIEDAPITIIVVTRDGDAVKTEEGRITWNLSTDFAGGGIDKLPQVDLGAVNTPQTEDSPFALNEIVVGSIDTANANAGIFDMTITLRTAFDDETSFSPGMTRTEVLDNAGNVVEVIWTKTVTGLSNASAQSALDNALAGIIVSPPENANNNTNNTGNLPLDVTVALHSNGVQSEDSLKPVVELSPATDEATVAIVAAAVEEGQPVNIAITVSNSADKTGDWSIVGDKLYLQLEGTEIPGVLSQDGANLILESVSGLSGLTDGQYYVLDGVAPDTELKLTYTPAGAYDRGSVQLKGWVQNQETGSVAMVSQGEQDLTVKPTNTEPNVTITTVGSEHDGETITRAKLEISGTVLPDTNEVLELAFIEGLPTDFTVYYGANADGTEAVMAANVGGSGTTNDWTIPLTENALPAYIGIQPPAHWSGTLKDLKMYLVGGETGNSSTAWPIEFDLTIDPKADGLELLPTLSFGYAGDIVSLNLNADMKDPIKANDSDAYVELTQLELKGFPDGAKTVFYIGDEALTDGRVSFDATSNTHTINNLSQADLDRLGFLHAGTNGSQTINITAQTQEVDAAGTIVASSAKVTNTVAINISDKLATQGDDNFLWTGQSIDGRGGDDTIQLRFGEDLSANDLTTRLTNIEVLDLDIDGSNAIGDNTIGLSIQDVLDITDNGNSLKIEGDGNDAVFLNNSEWTSGGTSDGYVLYTDASSGASLSISDQITSITMVD
ncbi:MAG: DUF5801 repeats-in-toxin domain-containing protein [Spongiibacteraceae bacterium]